MDGDAVRRDVLDRLFDIRGYGAFVTGAARGIGFAIAQVLYEAGATVTMTDVDGDELEQARRRLDTGSGTIFAEALDVADAGAVDRSVARAAARTEGVQVVFANAGISAGPGPLTGGAMTSMDSARWDSVLSVNLTGAMATLRAAARHVPRDGRGRLVVTASIAGLRPEPMVGYAYAATKAAVVALVRQAAIELGPQNVLVNAIAPGPFLTSIGGGRLADPGVADSFAARAALGRIAAPAEIQGLALYLASPASSYVTGATFTIDGGSL